MNFWVGRLTREHDGIVAAAWRDDYRSIKDAVLGAGWRHTPVEDEIVGTRYSLESVEVGFTFVEAGSDGAVVIPIPDHEITWTMEPLGNQRRVIATRERTGDPA